METLSTLTNENRIFYEKTLLSRCLPRLCFYNFAQKAQIEPHSGNKINFRKFGSVSPVTTALTEGTTPSESSITVTKVEATASQYGQWLSFSDQLDIMGIDPVITQAAESLGETAAQVVDTVTCNIVSNGTNVIYPNTTYTDEDDIIATDVLTSAIIKRAMTNLKKSNIKPFSDGFYRCIIDPECASDLMADTLWQDVSKYSGGEKIEKGEIGRMYGIKFIESTQVKTYLNATSIKVHSICVFGPGAFGAVEISGQALPEFYYEDSAGTSDPLHLKKTVGFKMLYTAVRLNELGICRIDCAASA